MTAYASTTSPPPAPQKTAQSQVRPAQVEPIPYRHGGAGSDPSIMSALGTTLLLLAAIATLAWHARRKGWLDRWITARQPVAGRRLVVLETTALSRNTRLYRIRDGEREFLLAESTGQVLVVDRLATTELSP
jgi:flagellar biogenesis protein FliO